MVIGVSMATIGYYSNDFVLGESRNGTQQHSGGLRKTADQRGLHLNNLSYMGPIVMGVGGEFKNREKPSSLVYDGPIKMFHGGLKGFPFRVNNTLKLKV